MTSSWFVRYGRAGTVGVISTTDGVSLAAGEEVLLKSTLGLFLGEVLGPVHHPPAASPVTWVRHATTDDREQAEAVAGIAEQLVHVSCDRVAELGLPMMIVDADVSLDSTAGWLHALRWDSCQVDLLVSRLGGQFAFPVGVLDFSRPLSPSSGCGSCSSGRSCGTSCASRTTGGCSGCSCSTARHRTPRDNSGNIAGTVRQGHRVALL
ncbi:MAG: hypothetical protein N2039_09430 [Gemmataceae bacterium]|nr:hypothetical protein [Gemmataceae bacterium]